ncbi:MAG: ABC transporter permease, partial [Lachnospiraceae bacterium]|nr:ABC transporter permease [Lachnospiraceae bacterium]
MQRILRKRIFRDLKENFLRYLALGILIILGMYIVISLVAAAETIIKGTQKSAEAHKIEDGQFCVVEPLSDKEETALKETGITLEKMFYLDFLQEDGSTVRVYKNREKVNLLVLDEGHLAENAKELVLEKRYAEEHKLKPGDNIMISGTDFEVVGVGSVPD